MFRKINYRDSLIWFFCMLPIAALLRDLFLFEIGPIYFTTVKFVFLAGGILSIRYFIPRDILSKIITAPPVRSFYFFIAFLIFSIFYSKGLSIGSKVNDVLFFLIPLIMVFSISRLFHFVSIDIVLKRLFGVLKFIFYCSLILSTAQFIFSDQIIHGIGLYKENISYSITGFNVERLSLNEYLILGLGIVLIEKRLNVVIRILLIVWVVALVFITDSFTGKIGLLSLVLISTGFSLMKTVKVSVLLLIISLVILPFLKTSVLSSSAVEASDNRFERYFENYESENWRYYSSKKLIENFINQPTFFGHGHDSNVDFLAKYIVEYRDGRGGIKSMSPHVFVSIIYDQGIIGFTFFLIFLLLLGKVFIKLIRHLNSANENINLIKIGIIFIWLMILRLTFYYHAIIIWHFIPCLVIVNYFHSISWVSNKNK